MRAVWERFFATQPPPTSRPRKASSCGDRAAYRWRYDVRGRGPSAVSTSSVSRDGKVAEKLAYVKG